MSNTLGNYNAQFFADAALWWLRNNLAHLASHTRIQPGVDLSPAVPITEESGSVVQLRRPSTFAGRDNVAPTGSSRQDIQSETATVTLSEHKEVKFEVTDKELAYTRERIIEDHVGPATRAIVEELDTYIHGTLGDLIPNRIDHSIPVGAHTFVRPRAMLRRNLLREDEPLYYVVSMTTEADLLRAKVVASREVAGEGVETSLKSGIIPTRFGIDTLPTQTADQVFGGIGPDFTNPGDQSLTIAARIGGRHAESFLFLEGADSSGARYVKGDTFSVGGSNTRYILTQDSTFANGRGYVRFFPALRGNWPYATSVLFGRRTLVEQGRHTRDILFAKDVFALTFGRLPKEAKGGSAEVSVSVDEDTSLSVRARIWYLGDTASVRVALDTLFGGTVLDARRAVQVVREAV